MFKLGITTIDELLVARETSSRIISGALLTKLDQLPEGESIEIRKKIIRSLLLPNTTGKTTWEGRFLELDVAITDYLIKNYAECLNVLDIGASDGVTSLDLFKRLNRRPFGSLKYVMSDLNSSIYLRDGLIWKDVIDDDGSLIQTTIGPFAVPITRFNHLHPFQLINKAIYLINASVRKPWLRFKWKYLGAFFRENWLVSLSLIAPEVQSMMQKDKRLTFKKMDLFSNGQEQYNFVRVLNVLNPISGTIGFTRKELIKGLHSVKNRVYPEGCLLLGRTVRRNKDQFVTNATLYRKKKVDLIEVMKFGNGSELGHYVSEC